MLISVVIIFHDQPQYVLRTMKSVVEQSYRNLDIIVVDDGSDISIEPIIQSLEDHRIHFFRMTKNTD